MLREVTVVLFTLIVAPVASAQGLQTCTVGTHIDAIGSNGSGTIIDTDEGQGRYHLLRYDNSTIEEWVTSPFSRRCAQARQRVRAMQAFTSVSGTRCTSGRDRPVRWHLRVAHRSTG